MGKASVEVGAGTFAPGQKVGLHYRVGDWAAPGNVGKAAESAKVADDGTVVFDGFEPGVPFWVVGEDPFVAVAAVAKEPVEAKVDAGPSKKVRDELKAQSQASSDMNQGPVEGMRSTATRKATPGTDQAALNRQTAESVLRTEKDLAKQEGADLDSVDATSLAFAKGVDPGLGGTSGVETLADLEDEPEEPKAKKAPAKK